MGCFIVPTTAALFTTAFGKHVPKNMHINWLNYLLWGGSAGLALEHIAHEEIVGYPPFLTAMESASSATVMLQEMAMIGTAMLLGCVGLWLAMVYAHNKFIAKRANPS